MIGADGLVGRALCADLRSAGREVHALAIRGLDDETQQRLQSLGVSLAEGNARNEEDIARAAKDLSAIVHAPLGPQAGTTLADHNAFTLIPIENALAAATTAGVKRFVLISSDAVTAGDFDRSYVTESIPHASVFLTPFAEALALAEALVLTAKAIETVVLRPALIWGAGDADTLPDVIERSRAGQLPIFGDGSTLVATTNVANLTAAVRAGLGAPDAVGKLYHITDDERISAKTFLTKLLVTAGVKAAPAPSAVSARLFTRLVRGAVVHPDQPTGATTSCASDACRTTTCRPRATTLVMTRSASTTGMKRLRESREHS